MNLVKDFHRNVKINHSFHRNVPSGKEGLPCFRVSFRFLMITGRQLPVIDVPFKSRTQIWLHLLTKISMNQSRTAWHRRRLKFRRFGVRLFTKMAIESKESLVLLKLTYFRATHFSVIRWIWSLDKLSSWVPPHFSRFKTCRVWLFWLQVLSIILDDRNNLVIILIDY